MDRYGKKICFNVKESEIRRKRATPKPSRSNADDSQTAFGNTPQGFMGTSRINLFINSVKLPSGFINCASGLTYASATCRMHPKNAYSKIQSVLSIQLHSLAVNSNTCLRSREMDAISVTITFGLGNFLCRSAMKSMACCASVP